MYMLIHIYKHCICSNANCATTPVEAHVTEGMLLRLGTQLDVLLPEPI